MSGIGTLGEGPLHASLKAWYQRPGDFTEIDVDGFVVDLRRGDELVEIQTRGFSKLRRKLDRLLDHHAFRIVHPIAAEKWIRRIDPSGGEISRRKSSKRGSVVDVCAELTSFPTLLSHPNFTLEVLLVQEEEVRQSGSRARRRRAWGVAERRLLGVLGREELASPTDLLSLLPERLPDPFTTAELAKALDRTRHLAQEVAYCLREAGVLRVVGRGRNGTAYRRS